jgi:hypothetical protein
MSVLIIAPQIRADETHREQSIVLEGIRLRIDTYTNIHDDSWYADFYNASDEPLILGLALIVGLDLWFPYRYKDLPPGILFVQDQSGAPFQDPTIPDFLEGDRALMYVTSDHEFSPRPAADPGEHIEPPLPT